MTLEEHVQQAKEWKTNHDLAWNTHEEQALLGKIHKLLKKETWKKMPASMLQDELTCIVPAFWNVYNKTISNLTKSRLTQSAKNG